MRYCLNCRTRLAFDSHSYFCSETCKLEWEYVNPHLLGNDRDVSWFIDEPKDYHDIDEEGNIID